jgi:DNA-binding MarR family transcriptional regulator
LSEFEIEVLAGLYRHRLLTTTQIVELHDPDGHRRWTQRRLRRLEHAGYVVRVTGRPPAREARWFLTGLGAELAEAAGDVPVREFRMDAHRAISGASRHLLAINDVGVSLVQAARGAGDVFDHTNWDLEVAHSYGPGKVDRLIVDAVVTYDVVHDGAVVSERRFVEVDRGTESVHGLVAKIVAYDQFFNWAPPRRQATSHLARLEWRRHYVEFPAVVFVFADLDSRAATRRVANLAGFLGSDPRLATTRVPVVATTLDALSNHGPFAEICVELPSQRRIPLFRRTGP